MLDAQVRAAYLCRLGLDAEPPSVDALGRVHRRHVERIPYETLWLHAGEAWDIDSARGARRIALGGRGGYCYHLNGALALLLESLGYDVTRHPGGVHGPDGPKDDFLGNHLVLIVRGLPSEENAHGAWYVDAGLGDALHDPLPLSAGVYDQGPFRLTLEEADAGGWHLAHDPAGGFTGMAWSTQPADDERLSYMHQWLSTSPESSFVKVPIVQTRDATGVDVVRGLMRIRVGEGASTETITRREDWFWVLAEQFGLRFEGIAPELLDALWAHTSEAHRAWQEAGGT